MNIPTMGQGSWVDSIKAQFNVPRFVPSETKRPTIPDISNLKIHPAALRNLPDVGGTPLRMPEKTNPILKWGLVAGGVLASIVLLKG